jgi:hypothetical protein
MTWLPKISLRRAHPPRLLFGFSGWFERRQTKRVHRANQDANGALDTVAWPRQPGQPIAQLKAVGGTYRYAISAAGTACFIERRKIQHGFSTIFFDLDGVVVLLASNRLQQPADDFNEIVARLRWEQDYSGAQVPRQPG